MAKKVSKKNKKSKEEECCCTERCNKCNTKTVPIVDIKLDCWRDGGRFFETDIANSKTKILLHLRNNKICAMYFKINVDKKKKRVNINVVDYEVIILKDNIDIDNIGSINDIINKYKTFNMDEITEDDFDECGLLLFAMKSYLRTEYAADNVYIAEKKCEQCEKEKVEKESTQSNDQSKFDIN